MTSTPDTAPVPEDIPRIRSPRNWDGWLTIENADAVADRIRSMLAGRYFAFMSESQEAEAKLRVSCQIAATEYTDGRDHQATGVSVSHPESGGFASVDIYIPGTGWPFIDTHIPSLQALQDGYVPSRSDTWMCFQEKSFTWRYNNAMGEWRRHTIMVEAGLPAPAEEEH